MKSNASEELTYLLRNDPEDLSMDDQGWVSVNDLLTKLNITQEELDHIIENLNPEFFTLHNKKRFFYNNDKSKIRSYQGHSAKLNLKIEYPEVSAPVTYYHGTEVKNMESILNEGLISKNRNYVYLAKDIKLAVMIGSKHGSDVVVFEVDAKRMKLDGYKIFESDDFFILIEKVPLKYLKICHAPGMCSVEFPFFYHKKELK